MLYPVAVERGDDDHAYGVTVPDIQGCFSAGDTFEEAMNKIDKKQPNAIKKDFQINFLKELANK